MTITYKVKSAYFSDWEWWDCELLITVDDKGRIISVEEKRI